MPVVVGDSDLNWVVKFGEGAPIPVLLLVKEVAVDPLRVLKSWIASKSFEIKCETVLAVKELVGLLSGFPYPFFVVLVGVVVLVEFGEGGIRGLVSGTTCGILIDRLGAASETPRPERVSSIRRGAGGLDRNVLVDGLPERSVELPAAMTAAAVAVRLARSFSRSLCRERCSDFLDSK